MLSHSADFRPANRLTKPEEFKKVFNSPSKSFDKQFMFAVCDNGLGLARLGLAVPKRHIKQAVDRNRIKRIIRESFRINKDDLKGKDLVIMIRKTINKISLTSFNQSFKENCKKIS